MERLRAEQEAEEERSKRFREFAVNFEKEVRLKVEMEKREEIAERDARVKQSEDLERLAKSKMLESMDEIVNLTKRRVLHDLATDGESTESKEREGWLIETKNEADAEKSVLPTEKGQLSVPHISSRHATASTVRSASNASVKHPDTSLPSFWKGPIPEAPDPWGSGFESDDEATPGRAGTDTQRPSEHKNTPRRSMFERQQERLATHRADISRIERLVEQIADAVMERLMHSRYNEVLMNRPPHTGQYYRQHVRPTANPFAAAPSPFTIARQFGNEDASTYYQVPPSCGPSRRFHNPPNLKPKPARLQGRTIKGQIVQLPLDPPSHNQPSSQKIPLSTS
ncbi:hypothetical protein IL306_001525 [Fusarium sp. DS 682]|nr:hypothetical protein IL306_001525 [Fusarium sp. DS 682]